VVIQLGDYVKDSISGFEGVVTARTEYQNGNIKLCVETCELDAGKPIAEVWFDAYRVEPCKRNKKLTPGMP
jgi:hypothetical protein